MTLLLVICRVCLVGLCSFGQKYPASCFVPGCRWPLPGEYAVLFGWSSPLRLWLFPTFRGFPRGGGGGVWPSLIHGAAPRAPCTNWACVVSGTCVVWDWVRPTSSERGLSVSRRGVDRVQLYTLHKGGSSLRTPRIPGSTVITYCTSTLQVSLSFVYLDTGFIPDICLAYILPYCTPVCFISEGSSLYSTQPYTILGT